MPSLNWVEKARDEGGFFVCGERPSAERGSTEAS